MLKVHACGLKKIAHCTFEITNLLNSHGICYTLPIPTESCKPQKFTLTSFTILTKTNCLFNQGRLYFPDSINCLSRLVLISIIFRNPQYCETDLLKLIQINSNIK